MRKILVVAIAVTAFGCEKPQAREEEREEARVGASPAAPSAIAVALEPGKSYDPTFRGCSGG